MHWCLMSMNRPWFTDLIFPCNCNNMVHAMQLLTSLWRFTLYNCWFAHLCNQELIHIDWQNGAQKLFRPKYKTHTINHQNEQIDKELHPMCHVNDGITRGTLFHPSPLSCSATKYVFHTAEAFVGHYHDRLGFLQNKYYSYHISLLSPSLLL